MGSRLVSVRQTDGSGLKIIVNVILDGRQTVSCMSLRSYRLHTSKVYFPDLEISVFTAFPEDESSDFGDPLTFHL